MSMKHGQAGDLIKQSNETVKIPPCRHPVGCVHPAWMVWKKKLPKGKVALLLMNNMGHPANISVSWLEDLQMVPFAVQNVAVLCGMCTITGTLGCFLKASLPKS